MVVRPGSECHPATAQQSPLIRGKPERFHPEAILDAQSLRQLETRYDPGLRAIFCFMRPSGRPVVTQELLDELSRVHGQTRAAHALHPGGAFDFFVFGSRSRGAFSLGGDLAAFARCVRTGDRAFLHTYARSCIDIIYRNTQALHLPIVTIGMVQGDALGGGFEAAMSFDVLVAERSAKFCLPEALFNLFPGMGAYSLLTRKVGPLLAESLVSEGRTHTAAELHDLGVVDVLAEDGRGALEVASYIRKQARRLNARLAMNCARRRVNPLTHRELRDIVDIWTNAALELTEFDLRKMDRLVSAQNSRMALA